MKQGAWTSQHRVQKTFVSFLDDEGWTIHEAAETASPESGAELVARRGGVELVVEVGGLPDPGTEESSTRARHDAASAMLAGLLARDEDPERRIGLAFPDEPRYRNLLRRLRPSLEQLQLSVWFIAKDGRVTRWLGVPFLATATSPPADPTSAEPDDADDERGRFIAALAESARCHEDLLGRDPTGLGQLVAEPDPLDASRSMLRATEVSEGFVTLWEHGRLDETLEWHALAHPGLFSDEERQVAYERLYEYEVPIDLWLRDRLGRSKP